MSSAFLLAWPTLLALLASPAVEVSAEGPFLVGDPIPVRVTVPLDEGEAPAIPVWGESWGEAEIREVGPVERSVTPDGGEAATQTVYITFFDSGEFSLPAPIFESAAREQGPPDGDDGRVVDGLTIRVESVLPEGEELPPAQPIAPPRPLGWGRAFGWTTLALVLATVAAIALLLHRRAGAEPSSKRELVDPLASLESALEELRQERDPGAIFTSLSLCYRHFLGRVLAFPAAESTTSEIRRRLRATGLEPGLTTRSEQLLRRCDGIKFARQSASLDQGAAAILETLRIAREITDETSSPEGDGEEGT